jgi:hypothetical protein
MDSNHELEKFLKARNLLILKSRRSRQKRQKQASGTKSVQIFFLSLSEPWALRRRNDSCRKGLDLSIPIHKSGSFLGLVESDTGRGVFFTKLTGRLLLEVAVNKTQAETVSGFRTTA